MRVATGFVLHWPLRSNHEWLNDKATNMNAYIELGQCSAINGSGCRRWFATWFGEVGWILVFVVLRRRLKVLSSMSICLKISCQVETCSAGLIGFARSILVPDILNRKISSSPAKTCAVRVWISCPVPELGRPVLTVRNIYIFQSEIHILCIFPITLLSQTEIIFKML